MPKCFAIKLAGPAGTGIMSAGEVLFKAFVRSGFFCFGYPEYPSLIKGGLNTFLLTLSDSKTNLNADRVDLLVVFSQSALDQEMPILDSKTTVITDSEVKLPAIKISIHQPPLLNLAKSAGNPLALNTTFLAFLSHQLSLDQQLVLDLIIDSLKDKPQVVLDQNITAFRQALKLSQKFSLNLKLPPADNRSCRLCLTGSVATSLGAISAGLNLYAAYPMTPSSPLLHFLATHQDDFHYIVRQTEDEIAAINLTLGGSFAGARSMTGTSGGGFALMQEGVSLAGMLELPLVIYLGMRPGPATGLPTWTSQADLLFAVNSGHGEFPKLVLAPSDPRESYLLTYQAFNLSQKYQLPAIILSDKYLAESFFTETDLPSLPVIPLSITKPHKDQAGLFNRYAFNSKGISPRTLPGMEGGEYLANSDEHDAAGLVDESIHLRKLNNDRRRQKFSLLQAEVPGPEISNKGQSIALITWGSNKFIGREVINLGLKATHLHFSYLWPLPKNINQILSGFKTLIVIENTTTGQFARLLTSETAVKITQSLGDDTGRPLSPQNLYQQIKKDHGL
ncbi:2-oxoacid:acceptor oxidoreductase subunit alpha [Candidatus Collierbacteria bacterium]|nr:2-oxoacid:acceptor oxidoreductase subunit alpha [Candidatus Collierbacteria bacterium]